MSEFKGSMPKPKLDIGDIVRRKDGGIARVIKIEMEWVDFSVPITRYLVGGTWCLIGDFDREYTAHIEVTHV